MFQPSHLAVGPLGATSPARQAVAPGSYHRRLGGCAGAQRRGQHGQHSPRVIFELGPGCLVPACCSRSYAGAQPPAPEECYACVFCSPS